MDETTERVPTRLSVEEFEALPEEEGYKLELSATMLVREPPPGAEHGLLNAVLAHRLQAYAERTGTGTVLANAGFVLSHDPPIVRSPDVAWLAEADRSRLDARAWRGAPDLAVEIVSPSDRASEIQEKVSQYLAAGVRLVWVVDPRTRYAVVYSPSEAIRMVHAEGELEGGEVLPGFRLSLTDLFGR